VTVTAPPLSSSEPRSAETAPTPTPAAEPARESCPLCAAPLHPEQEWCLHCGAAARTRLAASPGWRGPVLTLVVVLVLSLGVLAGSLVKLAGGTPAPTTQTTTVTTSTAATATTPGALLPGATVTTPTTTIPRGAQGAQPGTGGAATTTPTLSGTTTIQPVKPKLPTKGPLGGIDLNHLKQSVAERLRKLGLANR
jgi:hypothetical protein